jgi:hypothetical protein
LARLSHPSGSAVIDGISLLASSIAQLLEKKCRTVVTTHFLEIFQHHLVPPVVATELAFRMDIHVPEEDNAAAGLSRV